MNKIFKLCLVWDSLFEFGKVSFVEEQNPQVSNSLSKTNKQEKKYNQINIFILLGNFTVEQGVLICGSFLTWVSEGPLGTAKHLYSLYSPCFSQQFPIQRNKRK